MSYLTSGEIRELIFHGDNGKRLITPGVQPSWFANGREFQDWWMKRLDEIDGGAFDLTVEEVHQITGGQPPTIGRNNRVTPVTRPVPHVGFDDASPWLLMPNTYYLIKTFEELHLPSNIGGDLYARTAVTWSGGIPVFGPIQPGYTGPLTVGLYVFNPEGILLERGARFITIRFSRLTTDEPHVSGDGRRGDRMYTQGKLERGR